MKKEKRAVIRAIAVKLNNVFIDYLRNKGKEVKSERRRKDGKV